MGVISSAFSSGTDYDRNLMPAIAVAGRGDFIALDRWEYVEQVSAVASRVIQPFAVNISLWLTPLRGAKKLTTIGHRRRTNGGPYDKHTAGAAVIVPIGTLPYFRAHELFTTVSLPSLRVATEFMFFELVGTIWGRSSSEVLLSGTVQIKTVRTGVQVAPPNRGMELLSQLEKLMLREETLGTSECYAEREQLENELLTFSQIARTAEAQDPTIAPLGIPARALAAQKRMALQCGSLSGSWSCRA